MGEGVDRSSSIMHTATDKLTSLAVVWYSKTEVYVMVKLYSNLFALVNCYA